jgi:hypothetical protein
MIPYGRARIIDPYDGDQLSYYRNHVLYGDEWEFNAYCYRPGPDCMICHHAIEEPLAGSTEVHREYAHILEGYTAHDCICLRKGIECLPGPSEAETL